MNLSDLVDIIWEEIISHKVDLKSIHKIISNRLNLKTIHNILPPSVIEDKSLFLEILFTNSELTLCPPIHFIFFQEENKLMHEIFNYYGDELKSYAPQKWTPLLWLNENRVNKEVLNFYGNEYYDKILQSSNTDMDRYSVNWLKKVKEKECDKLYFGNLNNLKEYVFSQGYSYEQNEIALILFLANNTEEEIKRYLVEAFKMQDKEGLFVFLTEGGKTNSYMPLITNNTINFIQDSFEEKSTEIFYSVFRIKDFISTMLDIPLVAESSEFVKLMSLGIDFNPIGKEIIKYIAKDKDLLMYSLMTNKISHTAYLDVMDNEELRKITHYHLLQKEIKEKASIENQSITKKPKI